MCVFLSLLFFGPRIAVVIWWLLNPARIYLAFSSTLLAIFGLLFVPWTTLMYLIVVPGGVNGIEWLFIGISVFFDIGSYAGGAKRAL